MTDFRNIVLTGAGFTRAFCSDAPLMHNAIGKTICHAFSSQLLNSSKASICKTYALYRSLRHFKYDDIEDMFDLYFELEKKLRGGGLSSEEFEFKSNFGRFKMAFTHLLDSTTPWGSDQIAERCKGNEANIEYFQNGLKDYLQITLNYDTLIESLLDFYPEPDDHKCQIQHLHGSLGWGLGIDGKIKNLGNNDRGYSSVMASEDERLILTSKKEEMFGRYSWYKDKYNVIEEYFKNAEKIFIIGCNVDRDESIIKLLENGDGQVIYVCKEDKKPEFFKRLDGGRVKPIINGGFEPGCLDRYL